MLKIVVTKDADRERERETERGLVVKSQTSYIDDKNINKGEKTLCIPRNKLYINAVYNIPMRMES